MNKVWVIEDDAATGIDFEDLRVGDIVATVTATRNIGIFL